MLVFFRMRTGSLVRTALVFMLTVAAIGPGWAAWHSKQSRVESGVSTPSITPTATAIVTPAKPVHIKIERIGVDADIVPLGLRPNRQLDVPANPWRVGWYIHSSKPGDVGSAILVGHLDSTTGPAVFYRLRELQPGDVIELREENGVSAYFKMTSAESYQQDAFPTQQVYGKIDYPGLRLITCDGWFDRSQARYSNNLVIYARKI